MNIHYLPDDVAAFLAAIARGDAWAEMEDDASNLLLEHKREPISKDEWIWYGSAAHFIGGKDCRFHMATRIGDTLVSSVGDYRPDRKGPAKEIGSSFGMDGEALFETFVFEVGNEECRCGCGIPKLLDAAAGFGPRASTQSEAQDNHRWICDEVAQGTWGADS